MTGLEPLVLVGIAAGVLVAGVVGVATLIARGRGRRNRVVPEVSTSAPSSWAGAHTPLARLHRRLRAAVEAVRAVPDPEGALIRARIEVEQAAVTVDDHLVALDAMPERERAGRMAQATAAVASVEEAAAQLADAAAATTVGGALPAVADALERAMLVAAARRELDDDPAAILQDGAVDGPLPEVAHGDPGDAEVEGGDEQPTTG